MRSLTHRNFQPSQSVSSKNIFMLRNDHWNIFSKACYLVLSVLMESVLELIDYGHIKATKQTRKWKPCCCSYKQLHSKTALLNGFAIIAFIINSVTRTQILTMQAEDSFSPIWDGSCAKSILMLESMGPELTWVIWNPIRGWGFNTSKKHELKHKMWVNSSNIFRYYMLLVLLISFGLPIFLSTYFFGDSVIVAYYFNLFRYVLTLHITWSINSVSHIWGGKPFEK